MAKMDHERRHIADLRRIAIAVEAGSPASRDYRDWLDKHARARTRDQAAAELTAADVDAWLATRPPIRSARQQKKLDRRQRK